MLLPRRLPRPLPRRPVVVVCLSGGIPPSICRSVCSARWRCVFVVEGELRHLAPLVLSSSFSCCCCLLLPRQSHPSSSRPRPPAPSAGRLTGGRSAGVARVECATSHRGADLFPRRLIDFHSPSVDGSDRLGSTPRSTMVIRRFCFSESAPSLDLYGYLRSRRAPPEVPRSSVKDQASVRDHL